MSSYSRHKRCLVDHAGLLEVPISGLAEDCIIIKISLVGLSSLFGITKILLDKLQLHLFNVLKILIRTN